MQNTTGPLGRVYTLNEAAEYLRMNSRSVAKVARKSGLCSVNGRDLLFSDSDLLAIWDSMRCPSPNSDVETKATGSSAVQCEDKAFMNLQERAMSKQRKQFASKRRFAY